MDKEKVMELFNDADGTVVHVLLVNTEDDRQAVKFLDGPLSDEIVRLDQYDLKTIY